MLPASHPLEMGAVQTSAEATARKRKGSASELRAAVHLMQQGFDVYRCVAEHAVFDLVAHRDGQLYRVEVKTLSKPKQASYVPVISWPVNTDWDIVMFCAEDKIFQFPAGVTRDEVRGEVIRHLAITRADSTPSRHKGDHLTNRIAAILEERPDVTFNCREMHAELLRRGMQPRPQPRSQPSTLVSAALAALYNRGIADRIGHGVYQYAVGPDA